MKKILSVILVLALAMSMVGCVPEAPKTVEIAVTGVEQGASVSAAAVEVSYGVEAVSSSISWGVAKGDEIVDLGDITRFDVGYYQLTITYSLPANATEVPVTVTAGELTGTQALGDGKYSATIAFYFAPVEPEETEPQLERLITVSIAGAESGLAVADATVTVSYGTQPLESSITWGVAKGDELVAPEAGSTFSVGVYRANITYTIPQELIPTDGEGIPVMVTAGELIKTQDLGDGQYSAEVSFYFEGECEHSWMAIPHTGICTEGIVKHAVCTVCGATQDHPEEPKDHSLDWENATGEAANCAKDGKYHVPCLVCGTVVEIIDKATGDHSFETVILGGNCANGLRVKRVCLTCGETREETIYTRHNFGPAEYYNNHQHGSTCINCGEVEMSYHSTDRYGYCAACGHYIVN